MIVRVVVVWVGCVIVVGNGWYDVYVCCIVFGVMWLSFGVL